MQKKIFSYLLATLTSLFTAHAYAVSPGLYLGFMAGPATNGGEVENAQVQNSSTTIRVHPRSNQFASRIFMGYKVNKYASVEGGFTYFSSINYVTNSTTQTCSGTNVRVRDADLLGKISIPLGSTFDVFGKVGVAAVYTSSSSALNPNLNSTCGNATSAVKARPAFAAGASYDLSQNWVADMSWNRVIVGSFPKNIDFFALGISYHFVDTFCGQFLCD